MLFRAVQHALRQRQGMSRAGAPVALLPGVAAGRFSTTTADDSQRLALITGAASGIGAATAREFIRHGAKVILADVQENEGRALAAELGASVWRERWYGIGGRALQARMQLLCRARMQLLRRRRGARLLGARASPPGEDAAPPRPAIPFYLPFLLTARRNGRAGPTATQADGVRPGKR